eukprot:scaffold22052_cov36-Cyclotella_meneghiniana.AAC.3
MAGLASREPVASRKVASFCACAWRRGQAGVGQWYDWQALASQSPHSPGDWLTTAPVVSQSPGVKYQATATGRRGLSCAPGG